MFRNLVLVFTILMVSSCTSLSNKGANVLLVDSRDHLPKECSFIKHVESAASKSDISSSFAIAKIRLRNEAAEENANYVVISKMSDGLFLGSAVIGGDAYRCNT